MGSVEHVELVSVLGEIVDSLRLIAAELVKLGEIIEDTTPRGRQP